MNSPDSPDHASESRRRGTTLRNVAMVSAAGQVESVVGLIAGVLIARGLGPHDFGQYAYAIWLCGWMILASNHALTTTSIKFLAETRGTGDLGVTAALAARARRIQIVSSGIVLGAFGVIAGLWPPDDWEGSLLLYLALAVIAVWARAGFWSLGAIAKGYERFEPENAALALTALVYLGLVLGVRAFGGTAVHYFAAYAIAGLVYNLIVRVAIARCDVAIRPGPIPDELRRRFDRQLLLSGIIIILGLLGHRTIEFAFLKTFATAAEVGYFAIAMTLTKGALDLLGNGLSAVVLPGMARAFGRGGRESLNQRFSEAARLYWLVGMAVAGGGVVVTDGVMHLLYGHRYEGAIPAVVWSLVLGGATMIGSATTALMVAGDRQSDRIKVNVIGLAVSLAAALALIPRWGLMGALGCLAIREVSGHLMVYAYARRHFGARLPLAMMARALVAAVAGAIAGALVGKAVGGPLAFVPGGLAFCMVFAALLIVLRALKPGDYAAVAHLLNGRGRSGSRLGGAVERLGRRFAGAA